MGLVCLWWEWEGRGVGVQGAGGGLGGWGGCADALRADERSPHKAESMSQGRRGGLVRAGFGFGFGFAGIRAELHQAEHKPTNWQD
jgi:hypothetical protein